MPYWEYLFYGITGAIGFSVGFVVIVSVLDFIGSWIAFRRDDLPKSGRTGS